MSRNNSQMSIPEHCRGGNCTCIQSYLRAHMRLGMVNPEWTFGDAARDMLEIIEDLFFTFKCMAKSYPDEEYRVWAKKVLKLHYFNGLGKEIRERSLLQ